MKKTKLISKYNIPGPRYTSYPTVPFWENDPLEPKKWIENLQKTYTQSPKKEISLYIHLPFCENLCTFCGCNKRITKQHSVEIPYIETVLREWEMYLKYLETRPIIKEIHLGGGTPTFFSPENLKYFLSSLFEKADIPNDDKEFSFEGHPNNTTKQHLKMFYDLGFRRVSFGIQDYDPLVQKAINRIQPYENVKRVTETAREIGYQSVGHDLVFGLPFQTQEMVRKNMKHTKTLVPDRIAYYSYAHVPWIKGLGQRGFKDNDIPKDSEKRILYEIGKEELSELGYIEIGMDHFALKTDSIYKAMESQNLHRNFMGYTTQSTDILLGLGVSSISDSGNCFAQNEKDLKKYQEKVKSYQLPIYRGHILNHEDRTIRKHILDLMCHFKTKMNGNGIDYQKIIQRLDEPLADELITFDQKNLQVLEKGKPFVRNICMAFDLRLERRKPKGKIFSMTV